MSKEIRKIEFCVEQDTYADLSHLGEYSNEYEDGAIERDKEGDWNSREYRYFIPAMSGEMTGNPDSPKEDYRRMEDYNRGEWHMCFCFAKATIVVDGVKNTITSGGLGGVESDSDKSHFKEIEKDEIDSLVQILMSLGFSEEEIKNAPHAKS